MIIVALGSYSSGSTWIFNVIRSIISNISTNSVSFYCDNSSEALKKLSGNPDHVVIKSHSLDQDFFNLIRVSGAKIVVSTRDPRDSYVSLSQRFGYTDTVLIDQISRSFTVSALARADLDCLTFIYEEGFTEDPQSIDRIAEHLGITLNDTERDAIFARHSRASVKSAVKQLEEQGHDAHWFDPATLWHPGHVGDGQVGKWLDALPTERATVLNDALTSYYGGTYRGAETILWQSSLFRFADGRNPVGESELLQTTNVDAHLVYGPYLFLPPGRWQARFLLSTSQKEVSPASLRIDICASGQSLELYAMKKIRVSSEDKHMPTLEFEHGDHLRSVEARIHSASGGAPTDFYFSGVRFSWLGEIEPDWNDAVLIAPVAGDQDQGL